MEQWVTETQALLDAYEALEYAPENASEKLLSEFGATEVRFIPVHRQQEFRDALAYRTGACENLAKSRAVHPSKLNKTQDGTP